MRNVVFLGLVLLVFGITSARAEEITLVKRASRPEPSGTVSYTVKEGDTLWKIFMDEFGAEADDLPYFYEKFREANPGIQNLNRILAGQKIVIPEVMETEQGIVVKPATPEVYVIKQGQHIAMVLREVYGLPDKQIFTEYIDLVEELNPQIEDIDHVVPGQEIRMPKIHEVRAAYEQQQKRTPDVEPVEISPEPVEVPQVASAPPVQEALPEDEETGEKEGLTQEEEMVEQPPVPSESPSLQETRHQEAVTPPPPAAEDISTVNGETGDEGGEGKTVRIVKESILPALQSMGGRQKNQGSYFMPMAGGSSITIDTNEIPVIELDTGKRIVFDMHSKISPEIGDLVEQAFPSFKVISGPSENLEEMMDRVLSVSGYFSVNKDASPLLVGEEEKVRFFGKWIVYKEYSRRSVFVINILDGQDIRTPTPIRKYASRFGIDIIELGGRKSESSRPAEGTLTSLNRSYPALLDRLGVPYERDKEIELVKSDPVRIVYTAPMISGNVILTETMPEVTMSSFLEKKGYRLVDTRVKDLETVLQDLGLPREGPPVTITVAEGRTEVELPALQVGSSILLTRSVDGDIASYLASTGKDVILW
ncbi:MAG: LysM peptidoglycan-binding domain-containing protein [Desulfomonilia bacterium]